MRLNSNPLAMNAIRNMWSTGNKQADALKKLSSGKRINRAADDAAGYAISEKMLLQAQGLARASKNALDGVSMVQTAEASLNEVHDMLQRMRELSVQAANDTNKQEDRDAIQQEINQLTSEINRVGETTEFNKIKVFSADYEDGAAKPTMAIPVQGGANANQLIDLDFQVVSGTYLGISSVVAGSTNVPNINKVEVSQLDGTTLLAKDIDKTLYPNDPDRLKKLEQDAKNKANAMPNTEKYIVGAKFSDKFEMQNKSIKVRGANSKPEVDATTGNFIYKKEYPLDVTTHESATSAVQAFDNAIAKISELRASLGAAQNRMEHTIKSLDSAEENITEAMSRLQDADMAEEMSNFTKYNVISQAGQSMLQQANQMPQQVLKMLEG